MIVKVETYLFNLKSNESISKVQLFSEKVDFLYYDLLVGRLTLKYEELLVYSTTLLVLIIKRRSTSPQRSTTYY